MAAVLVMSGVINVLALSGAFYMLQVYDRVLTSQSVPTLVVLSILVAGLYVAFGLLDVLRGQLMLRIGTRLDVLIMPAAYSAAVRGQLGGQAPHEALQPVRDVDTVRNFLASAGPLAVADLPWMPIFLVFVWFLSPALAAVTAAGVAFLVVIAMVTDFATRRLEKRISAAGLSRSLELDATLRNCEPLVAMGMKPEAALRFLKSHNEVVAYQRKAGDIVMALGGLSKVTRLMLQSAILGFGAFLAIKGDISLGAIVAASIASARALAPVEQAITGWRALSQARAGMQRLAPLLAQPAGDARAITLPSPKRTAALDQIAVRAPVSGNLLLHSVSMQLNAGQGLAIVGASGSGKSTLARVIAGVWVPAHGTVRLDGAPIDRWDQADRGGFIGYMPQHVDLFPATIAENIARLDETPDSRAVIAAAEAAGIHDVILNLPQGYETRLGLGGTPLSAGQRQQIGLARALYGNPFLVVLDEPNANLDQQGEEALIKALKSVREKGSIVVVVAHRRSILSALDTVAVVDAGRLKTFGAKADVLRGMAERIDDAPLETKVTTIQNGVNSRRTAS